MAAASRVLAETHFGHRALVLNGLGERDVPAMWIRLMRPSSRTFSKSRYVGFAFS
jgi:hypothetical protein